MQTEKGTDYPPDNVELQPLELKKYQPDKDSEAKD
jgi:hypothetical protein